MTLDAQREPDHLHDSSAFLPRSGATVRTWWHEWEKDLRKHMWNRHGASADWAKLVDFDLIRELHNREHGRDAQGDSLEVSS